MQPFAPPGPPPPPGPQPPPAPPGPPPLAPQAPYAGPQAPAPYPAPQGPPFASPPPTPATSPAAGTGVPGVSPELVAKVIELVDAEKERERARRHFDWFELATAIALGTGALCGALTAYWGSNWASASQQHYAEADRAAGEATEALNIGMGFFQHDSQILLRVKELTVIAATTTDEVERKRNVLLARHFIVDQLSPAASEALGIDAKYRRGEGKGPREELSDKDLVAIAKKDLGNDYVKTVLSKAVAANGKARELGQSAREDSDNSTRFGQVGLFYTVTLFLGGLALVIKTKPRWAFLGISAAVLLVATIRLLILSKP